MSEKMMNDRIDIWKNQKVSIKDSIKNKMIEIENLKNLIKDKNSDIENIKKLKHAEKYFSKLLLLSIILSTVLFSFLAATPILTLLGPILKITALLISTILPTLTSGIIFNKKYPVKELINIANSYDLSNENMPNIISELKNQISEFKNIIIELENDIEKNNDRLTLLDSVMQDLEEMKRNINVVETPNDDITYNKTI